MTIGSSTSQAVGQSTRSISGSRAAAASSVSCNQGNLSFSSSTAPETTSLVVGSLATSQSCRLALLGVHSQPRTAHKPKEKCEQELRAIEGFSPVPVKTMRSAASSCSLRSSSQKTSGFPPQTGRQTLSKGAATIRRMDQDCGYGNRSKTA